MGWHMAGHIQSKAKQDGVKINCKVWNRTHEVAEKHALEFGSEASASVKNASADYVFCCLPTSEVVRSVMAELGPHLPRGAIVVDCTSGDPAITQEIAKDLAKLDRDLRIVDSPVSGGPAGAEAGTVTSMIGGDQDAVEAVMPLIETYSKTAKHVGIASAGHAVKAINNALNASHLAIAAEGLLALQKAGVSPDAALSVINSSSGRSLQTEVRMEQCVLHRDFNYGFKVGLMEKDVGIANSIMENFFPNVDQVTEGAPAASSSSSSDGVQVEGYFGRTLRILRKTVKELGGDADYTELVKCIENTAGHKLDIGPRKPKTDEYEVY